MNPMSASAAARVRQTPDGGWCKLTDTVVVGKDILELLSTSMYVDPMAVYREYIQNAVDAVDLLRSRQLVSESTDVGRVDINIDAVSRSIRIRDNGVSLSADEFVSRLTAFGGSMKRGTEARGFRGVGRLAGLAYCRELIFRAQAQDERVVSELAWDCRKLKTALASSSFSNDLGELVREIVTIRQVMQDSSHLGPFFEVELRGVIRHKNDQLLNASAVADYLSQVSPVPFHPTFRWNEKIKALLGNNVRGNLHIHIDGATHPLYRPHRDVIQISTKEADAFTDIDTFQIPATDGGVAALAWVLHHGYTGALPVSARIKGLRVRCGDIQIGDQTIVEDLFPEPRFNAWSVGEVHIIDRRIMPNGRRDNFEQNVHLHNLLNHLAPVAREIARRCRASSIERRMRREFDRHRELIEEKRSVITQRGISLKARDRLRKEILDSLQEMEKIAGADSLITARAELTAVVQRIRTRLDKISVIEDLDPLAHLPRGRREIYTQVFDLIYECSTNRTVARILIDKLLAKLATAAQPTRIRPPQARRSRL